MLPLTLAAILLMNVDALNNGLGLTPPMGWNAWYAFGCNITESLVYQITDKLVELGLDKYGYEYINLDDCWQGGRYSNGTIYGQSPQFNASLLSLSNYIHSKGLKFGIYTDRGTETCMKRPGSFGYEHIDAQTYYQWNVDYLKEDSCYATGHNYTQSFAEYAIMRDALNATGRPIFFNLAETDYQYSSVGKSLANSWRVAFDGNSWINILKTIDTMAIYNLHRWSGIGGWNDPCLLLAQGDHAAITEIQSRTQFSMWAILAAPLLLSSDIRNISTYTLETYTNQYVIDINQDIGGKQGYRIQGDNLATDVSNKSNGTNIWARELIDGSRAMLFINVGPNDNMNITCDATCFSNAGFYNDKSLGLNIMVSVYDVWNDNKLIGNFSTATDFTVHNVGIDQIIMYRMYPYFEYGYPGNIKRDL